MTRKLDSIDQSQIRRILRKTPYVPLTGIEPDKINTMDDLILHLDRMSDVLQSVAATEGLLREKLDTHRFMFQGLGMILSEVRAAEKESRDIRREALRRAGVEDPDEEDCTP